jgi:hypothetical protein
MERGTESSETESWVRLQWCASAVHWQRALLPVLLKLVWYHLLRCDSGIR